MLSYRLLRNHAGILLMGDYESLVQLHEIVHDVNDRSPLIDDEEVVFLGLAYDLRKAYEQQREIIPPPDGHEEIGTRFGVEILWPVLMVQQRLLRVSLSYMDHSKRHQAVTYALEALMEDAVAEDFGGRAARIYQLWQRIDPASPWPMAKLDSRGAVFSSWTKAERKRHFADLLESFDPLYPSLYLARLAQGQQVDALAPEALDAWANQEWVDPRW